MPYRDDATNCKGSSWSSLPFFLVMIDSWWPEPNLDTYSSRMRFFSFEPETEVDRPDIGGGREGVHDWGGARGSAAFLFDAATKAAGVEEGRTFLGCLIDCLIWDSFMMTKELCSLLLSPYSNNGVLVGKVGCTTQGGDGGANPSKAR
jgi:hypothetical protein